MSRKSKHPELKAELKQLSASIRATRIRYKEAQRENEYKKYIGELISLEKFRYTFRYKHIAYCLLHGTPMEKIESSISPMYNPPSKKLIEELMEQYGKNVCACS